MAEGDRAATLDQIHHNLTRIIVGKDSELRMLLAGLLSGGHILLEDIPGVGKTTLAKALARSIGGKFSRIQFTPDLLPTDIVGASIFNPKDGEFHYKPGPVFANVVLADEINRASPRTQSALIEAMGEHQVTVDGRSRHLEPPFLVIATQNPIESHGTYPLPEAQLDRFNMRLRLGYPPGDEEMRILAGQGGALRLGELLPITDPGGIVRMQQAATTVGMEKSVIRYALDIIEATRSHPSIRLGASPRGALAMLAVGRGFALIRGMDHLTPDHLRAVAVPALAHRLVLDAKAKYAGVRKSAVVEEILDKVPVPR